MLYQLVHIDCRTLRQQVVRAAPPQQKSPLASHGSLATNFPFVDSTAWLLVPTVLDRRPDIHFSNLFDKCVRYHCDISSCIDIRPHRMTIQMQIELTMGGAPACQHLPKMLLHPPQSRAQITHSSCWPADSFVAWPFLPHLRHSASWAGYRWQLWSGDSPHMHTMWIQFLTSTSDVPNALSSVKSAIT